MPAAHCPCTQTVSARSFGRTFIVPLSPSCSACSMLVDHTPRPLNLLCSIKFFFPFVFLRTSFFLFLLFVASSRFFLQGHFFFSYLVLPFSLGISDFVKFQLLSLIYFFRFRLGIFCIFWFLLLFIYLISREILYLVFVSLFVFPLFSPSVSCFLLFFIWRKLVTYLLSTFFFINQEILYSASIFH